MKFPKRAVLAGLCLAAVLLSAGCKTSNYTVYTNIPQDDYVIEDKTYTLGAAISGCTLSKPVTEDKDTSNYSSRGWSYYSMTADATLAVADDFTVEGSYERFTEFAGAIGKKLSEIDKALSTTVANSDVSNFNAARAGETIEIGETAFRVLNIAKSVYDFTEGYYNPALYYNVQAYGFGGAESFPHSAEELPKDEIIAKYTSLSAHFGEIELTAQEDKYFVTKPAYTVEVDGETLSMKLDLGGIGKGYAVDCVEELFDEYGYEYGYFSFSGSSMLLKRFLPNDKYPQDYFGIGFSSPRSPSREPYFTTSARNQKLSTSGDDNQKYFINGVRYCHIIDPTTGKPVQTGIMTASVIGGSAAEDDALTTAIIAMGKDKAIAFIENELKDRKVVFAAE